MNSSSTFSKAGRLVHGAAPTPHYHQHHQRDTSDMVSSPIPIPADYYVTSHAPPSQHSLIKGQTTSDGQLSGMMMGSSGDEQYRSHRESPSSCRKQQEFPKSMGKSNNHNNSSRCNHQRTMSPACGGGSAKLWDSGSQMSIMGKTASTVSSSTMMDDSSSFSPPRFISSSQLSEQREIDLAKQALKQVVRQASMNSALDTSKPGEIHVVQDGGGRNNGEPSLVSPSGQQQKKSHYEEVDVTVPPAQWMHSPRVRGGGEHGGGELKSNSKKAGSSAVEEAPSTPRTISTRKSRNLMSMATAAAAAATSTLSPSKLGSAGRKGLKSLSKSPKRNGRESGSERIKPSAKFQPKPTVSTWPTPPPSPVPTPQEDEDDEAESLIIPRTADNREYLAARKKAVQEKFMQCGIIAAAQEGAAPVLMAVNKTSRGYTDATAAGKKRSSRRNKSNKRDIEKEETTPSLWNASYDDLYRKARKQTVEQMMRQGAASDSELLCSGGGKELSSRGDLRFLEVIDQLMQQGMSESDLVDMIKHASMLDGKPIAEEAYATETGVAEIDAMLEPDTTSENRKKSKKKSSKQKKASKEKKKKSAKANSHRTLAEAVAAGTAAAINEEIDPLDPGLTAASTIAEEEVPLAVTRKKPPRVFLPLPPPPPPQAQQRNFAPTPPPGAVYVYGPQHQQPNPYQWWANAPGTTMLDPSLFDAMKLRIEDGKLVDVEVKDGDPDSPLRNPRTAQMSLDLVKFLVETAKSNAAENKNLKMTSNEEGNDSE